MKAAIVIPARYASTRFPGKPLAKLKGHGGVERSLIEWSWRAACQVPGVAKVVVATDDARIADEVGRFGGLARRELITQRMEFFEWVVHVVTIVILRVPW